MSLFQIAWRNFCYRSLSSALTTLSLALGVGLVVLVLSIYGLITEAFVRNASVGCNLVVGPPGSDLQLVLNSVYYLSQPVENLDYEYYMEFLDQPTRADLLARYGGDPTLGDRAGRFSSAIAGGFAIPLALGDYLGEFRLVGTTPQFFEELKHGPDVDQPFTFREGRALQTLSPEHGFHEAVLGSRVAKAQGLSVGDTFSPVHGDPDGVGHDEEFMVVGILDPTGTPNDRAAFVNLEGFYLMDKHAQPISEQEQATMLAATATYEGDQPLPIPAREVTSILIRTGSMLFGATLPNAINESKQARAAAPIGEINKLMANIVGPLLTALLGITLITCVVAAVGVLVAIYNSMNDRRRDIAVMRALGARRDTVTMIILSESLIIAVVGGVCGWLVAHLAIWGASGYIEDNTGISVHMFTMSTYELYILPLVIALALLAGFLPASSAYRTDVGSNLAA